MGRQSNISWSGFCIGAAGLTILLSSCSNLVAGGSGSSPLTVSGSLALSNSGLGLGGQKISSLQKIESDSVSTLSVDLTQYTVTCATATTPVLYGSGHVAANGSFSVDIIGAASQPMSCFLVDSSGNRAADFIISDSAKKDLNGANQVTGTAVFSKNANMGTITFDPNSGEVTVPASQIAASVETPTAVNSIPPFDPSGAWTIAAVDFPLPAGVKGPCENSGGGQHNDCQGPPKGQNIYLKLWKGRQVSDSADIYGMQVWESAAQFGTCGSKIGLTPTIKTQIGVDFSANDAADDTFTFATSVTGFHDEATNSTGTVNLTNGWQMDTATTQYDINPNCAPHDITVGSVQYSNAWVCGPDSSSRYQAQLGGGCSDSAGHPVELRDWSGITCGSEAVDSDGVRTITCSGTVTIDSQSKAVSCVNKWAVTNSSFAVQPTGGFNWNDLNSARIPIGTLCSSIPTGTESSAIAQAQCYANYYQRSGFERNSTACVPKVDMDWSATTAAAFAVIDKIRPSGLVFFEQFKPFADGSGGSMVTRQEHYDGVNVNGNSWVNCRVIETGGLTIKRVTANKLIATYQQSTVTTSTSKPACMAAFTGSRQTFVFNLVR